MLRHLRSEVILSRYVATVKMEGQIYPILFDAARGCEVIDSCHILTGEVDAILEFSPQGSEEEVKSALSRLTERCDESGLTMRPNRFVVESEPHTGDFSKRRSIKCFVFVVPERYIDRFDVAHRVRKIAGTSLRGIYVIGVNKQLPILPGQVVAKVESTSIGPLATLLLEKILGLREVSTTRSAIVLKSYYRRKR